MAKLSARGRTELFRIERRYETPDTIDGGLTQRHDKYSFMDDGTILEWNSYLQKSTQYSPASWHNWGWKICQRKQKIENYAARVAKMVEKGWVQVNR
jgi:hypothetical protein